MNKLLSVLLLVVLFGGFAFAQEAPCNCMHKTGDVALLFTFNGLSDLSANEVNGGVGARYFFTPSMSFRGTVGAQVISQDNQPTQKAIHVSGALLVKLAETKNTGAYFGPSVQWAHSEPNINTYGLGFVLGAEVYPWHNISLGAEYGVGMTYQSVTGVTTTTLGSNNNGKLLLSVYL